MSAASRRAAAMSGRPRAWLYVVGALVSVFLIMPSAVVIVMSFSSGRLMTFPPPGYGIEWYRHFFQSGEWTGAALNSIRIGLLSAALATVAGTLTALGLVRGRPVAARTINALMMSPLIVPVVIAAIGMYLAYHRLGLGSFAGLVMGHTVLGIPFPTITVAASLYGLDPDLELAARNLGAGPLRSFWRVTLPMILPGVLVGAVFAFVASWDEIVVALFLTSPTFKTLPVTMWEQAKYTVDPTIAAASSMLTAFAMLVLVAVLSVRGLQSLQAGQRAERAGP